MKKSLFVCLMLLGAIASISAFPFANYGNIRVPDAYVMPHLMGEIAFDNYFHREHNHKDDDYAYNWAGAGTIGLFNYGELTLVGTRDEVYYGNVKVKLIGETIALPDISIGADNVFSKVNERQKSGKDIFDAGNYRRNSFFFALSKTILMGGVPGAGDVPVRATIGAGSNRFVGTVSFSRQFGGLFGAVQVEPVKNVALVGEIDGHNLNTSLGYTYKNFSARLNLYKIEEWYARDPKVGISVSYKIDQFAPEPQKPVQQIRRTSQGYDRGYDGSFDELQRIRIQREKAERDLEEIKRLLEE